MLSRKDLAEVATIFSEAIECDPAGRVGLLDARCGSRADLRAEVDALLAAHEQVDSFMEAPVELAAQALVEDRAESLVGRTAGPYTILSQLGAGGMGVVYLAHDARLGRKVALKLLPPYATKDPERLRRFQQEASAASKLNHPNILTIYEVGEVDSTHYIATEYIDGQTLRALMAQKQMSPGEAVDAVLQVASALSAAHAAGIVHRDIKPENIMVRPDGYVKVLDFGLVKLMTVRATAGPADQTLRTQPGVVMGTPRYMSPEQARGLELDARTDVWSLGVVLYEMVAGRPPFDGATPADVLAAILLAEPVPLDLHALQAPQTLGRLIARTLARHAADRFASARELHADLAALKTELDSGAGRTPASRPVNAVASDLQRKHATVLHCTIADASGVFERLEADGMHQLMRQLMERATDEIGRYGGVMSQQHADGFVAVFGAPMVHEDDGRRAILAALAIQQPLRELAAETGDVVKLQIGISSGPLMISGPADDRHGEYTAVGEAMKTAGLLQQFAEPGVILISEATRRAVEKYGSIELVVNPVPSGVLAYRVVGLLRERPARHVPAPAFAPFVGREHEMAVLGGLLTQTLSGHGQVVSVVAEPGMGKSRLVHEFAQPLASTARATVLEGRCVSYGSPIPYLPLTEIVRAVYGVEEADSPQVIQHAIGHTVAENGLPSDTAGWLLRLLGVADGPAAFDALRPEAVKAHTFDALRLLLLKAAGRRPLVIVVEDLHWIDRTSEEFLASLVERLVAARVLLVATHRPGYRAPWLDRSYVTQITLSPLTPADSARLVEAVVRDQPLGADLSNAILSRGEGNPFFLEELARTVLEHGAATDTIPGTVHGVIMARVDRLADVPKRLLQTASVIGREVPLGLLRRVWSGPADFDAELMELCRLEFLYERPTGDEPTYVFKHALTQDVAYDSLLTRTRRELHVRTAQALEELFADRLDDMAATLGYHYARTDLLGEAVTWLSRAADGAARDYANAEALLHLDLAARRLQLLPEGPERDRRMLDVALRQAYSLYFLGRFQDSVDVLLPHEARLERLDDAALTGACSFWLAHMYTRIGDPRAGESARRAIDAATAAGDDGTVGKAYGVLATESYWAGRPTEGIAHGMRSIGLLEPRPEDRWWLGMSHFYLAYSHKLLGDFEAALADTTRADGAGRDIDDPRLQTYAGYMAGWVEASRGNHDEAVARCRRSVELAPDRVSQAYASLFLGYALLEKGDHEQAQDVLRPIVSELEDFPFPFYLALAVTFIGETLRLQERLDEAAGSVERGLQAATRVGYAYGIGFAHRIAGRIARDRGSALEASTEFQQALQIFERAEAVFEVARTRLDLAEMAVRSGDPLQASRELTAAAHVFQALGVTVYGDLTARLAAGFGLSMTE